MSRKGENIYKRSDGRWEGRYKYGFDESGKTKYKSVYSKTYKGCREKLYQARNMLKKEKSGIKISIKMKELFSVWLESVIINLKQSTADAYMRIIKNHILPAMGNKYVKVITSEFLNKFIAEKSIGGRLDGKGGLSPKTVQNISGIIKSAFKYAEKIYGINNPANFIIVPRAAKKELEILTTEEIRKIKQYCGDNSDLFSLIYDLCLSTGIRIGELCALQYKDINFGEGIMKIEKTVQRVRDNSASKNKTKVIITAPKTKNSFRKIPLPENLLKRLKTFAAEKNSADFIFSYDGKKPLDVRTVQKNFVLMLKKCGIRKVKFHILRHTFATKWADSGFDIKGLSEILGHSSINITLSIYVHSSIEKKRKQISKLFEL